MDVYTENESACDYSAMDQDHNIHINETSPIVAYGVAHQENLPGENFIYHSCPAVVY